MSGTAQASGDRETLGRQGVEAWGKGKHSITVALEGGSLIKGGQERIPKAMTANLKSKVPRGPDQAELGYLERDAAENILTKHIV